MRAVDCQGFAGGFTLGVVQAGWDLAGKRELPGGFGVPSCEGNRHLLPGDWKTEVCGWTEWTPLDVEMVFGNPPCSGFSVMSDTKFRGQDSKINSCMWALAEYAGRCDPEIVIFESVQQAFTGGRELMQGLRAKVEEVSGHSYDLIHVLHNGYGLGGCALRPRYFWVASRVPFGVELPELKKEDLPVLRDAIGDLEDLDLQWEDQPYAHEPAAWAKDKRRDDGYVDGHVYWDTPNTERIVELTTGITWDEGENLDTVARRFHERYGTVPESWTPGLVKAALARDFDFGFHQPYRWKYDQPARTITGSSSQHALHPTEARMLTARECARIQGFPDEWRMSPLADHGGLFMWWGKGIAVSCGKWIAGNAYEALQGRPGSIVGEVIGERERKINVTHSWKALE